jgi:molybdopterin-guanine dinucleotide biosynthesis adapter protein
MKQMNLIGFAGWSGSGKTTLIEALIPVLTGRGLRVSLIKHAHHDVELDVPGKDSFRHRKAGCQEVLVTSGRRWALIHERPAPVQEPDLEEALIRLSPCDWVLVEGFKQAPIPKIEVHRTVLGKPLLWPDDPHIIAVASDVSVCGHLPWLRLDAPVCLADFIAPVVAKKEHDPSALMRASEPDPPAY